MPTPTDIALSIQDEFKVYQPVADPTRVGGVETLRRHGEGSESEDGTLLKLPLAA
jgi:hypothetical protein